MESETLKPIELADKHEALVYCSPVRGAAGAVYIAGIQPENPVTLAVVVEAAGTPLANVRKWKTLLAKELRIKKK